MKYRVVIKDSNGNVVWESGLIDKRRIANDILIGIKLETGQEAEIVEVECRDV